MEQLERLVGSVLDGRYLLLAVIGSGGSSVVFRADDLLLSRPVAIKMLRSEAFPTSASTEEGAAHNLARTEDARRINRSAFVQESRAAALLSHPNIVTIFDVSPETDNPYIVMELVAGRPLSERIAELGVLPLHELLYIARCVLEALAEAHENGIVHRDIKEQNILLCRSGGVKVTDFGIADIGGRGSLSPEGKVLGTADTMSPEQASGARLDARSDLYSLGVLMYRMATGHFPFEDEDPKTVAFLHRTEPPRYPSTLCPSIPRGLEQIILTALEKDPQKRFQDAGGMLAAVRRLERHPRHVFRRFARRAPLVRGYALRSAWLPAFCGALAAALLFVNVFLFSGLFNTRQCEIIELPSYVDLQADDGALLTLDPRIEVELQYVLRTDLPEGRVLSQSPQAGVRWKLDEEDDRKTLILTVVTHDQTKVTG